MSTEYVLHEDKHGDQLIAFEHSSKLDITINYPTTHQDMSILDLTDEQLTTIIIKLVEVLSYISADGAAVLKRFNVEYGQTK
jgi:hypothetical protein